jgi:hypothetical protein
MVMVVVERFIHKLVKRVHTKLFFVIGLAIFIQVVGRPLDELCFGNREEFPVDVHFDAVSITNNFPINFILGQKN